MTIGSELLLTTAHTAATGSDGITASVGKVKPQATDNIPAENRSHDFSILLARITGIQSSGEQLSDIPAIITQQEKAAPAIVSEQEMVPEIIQEAEDPEIIPETGNQSEYENSAENIISEPILAGASLSFPQIAEAEVTPVPYSQIPVEQTVTVMDITTAAKVAQEKNTPGKPIDEKTLPHTEPIRKTASPVGKAPEQIVQSQNIQETPLKVTDGQNVSTTRPATPGPAVQNITRTDTATTPPPESTDKSAAADISLDVAEIRHPLSPAIEGQDPPGFERPVPQTTILGQSAAAIPQDVTQVPAAVDKAPAIAAEMPPQQAAATIQPALHKDVNNSKASKDSSTKKIGKENYVATASGTKPATTMQNNIATAGPEHPMSPKIPFLAEPLQSISGAEGTGRGNLIPATGLLAVQEVGPNSLQTASLSPPKPPLPSVNPQMVTKQISMAIAKQAANGQESFKISLKPAHLGQVDIRMDFQADGKIIATVTVENERTLTLLQKDQGSLEKALGNAGFDAGGNNLNFSLKQQQHQGHSEFSDNKSADGESDDMSFPPASMINRQQMKMAYSDNLLDINI
ncbi:MAG: hypothetical protein COB49_04765 [Alphaproteobacteria bacterium]|nr:MAG: hypothetical protein COB49_04765 [Alphaproteobacteria bacterium]